MLVVSLVVSIIAARLLLLFSLTLSLSSLSSLLFSRLLDLLILCLQLEEVVLQLAQIQKEHVHLVEVDVALKSQIASQSR